MGYYFDWVNQKYHPIEHDREITPALQRKLVRRAQLVTALVTEIEKGGDQITRMYANLLARTLVCTDELLMREHGERVAKLSLDEPRKKRHGVTSFW